MTDQHVAGHLSDVFDEAQVHVWVLQPCQLQISIHVRAVGEAIT